MKKNIFISLVTLLLFVLNVTYAADVVKLGASITDDTYKENYKDGEKILIKLSIDESCEELGLLTGAVQFDSSLLGFKKAEGEGIAIKRNGEIKGYITPKYFDVGSGKFDNQIVFWIEDKYNRITEGNIGYIEFTTKKDIKAQDIKFSFIKVQACDFEIKNNYSFEQSKTNVVSSVKEPNLVEENEISNQIEEIKESVQEENNKRLSLILDTSEKNNDKKDISIDKKHIWKNVSKWAETEMDKAYTSDLIPESFENIDFTDNITRKHFAAVSVKLYEKISNKDVVISIDNPFVDTNDSYVIKAYELGITKGVSNDKFSPNSEITREQMATMIYRTLDKAGIYTTIDINSVDKFVDDNEMHSWGKEPIYFMAKKGIIKGISIKENKFGVLNNATIEQAIAISLRCIEKL